MRTGFFRIKESQRRTIELNLDRWLSRPEPDRDKRRNRNRVVAAMRSMLDGAKQRHRFERQRHKRHLRNERAKLRRRAS